MTKLLSLFRAFALDLNESIDWLLWERRRQSEAVLIPVRVDDR